MKRRFLLAFCLTVCLTLVLSNALAVSPQTAIVKSIASAFDAENWTYTVQGMVNDDKDELVTIKFDADNYPDAIQINIYARESAERVQLFVWNIIEYDASDFTKVLRAVNSLNSKYVYVKFFCDESDNTVTAEFDSYVPDYGAGDIVVDMIDSMVDIVDDAYDALSAYES